MKPYQKLLAAGCFSFAVWLFSGCGGHTEKESGAQPETEVAAAWEPADIKTAELYPPESQLNSHADSEDNTGDSQIDHQNAENQLVPFPVFPGDPPEAEFRSLANDTSEIGNQDDHDSAVAEELPIIKPDPGQSSAPRNPLIIPRERPTQSAGTLPPQTRPSQSRPNESHESRVVIQRPGGKVERHGYSNEVVYFATNRAPDESPRASTDPDLYFSAKRGQLTYGMCEVSIPYQREPGTLPAPSILKFEFNQDPARHVVLMQIQLLGDEHFWEALRLDVASRNEKQLMLFVHGYSASFRDAARRTAQMAYDMNYQGPAMFFSWPAGSETEGINRWNYTNDLRRADESCEDFITVIEAIAAQSGARSVHMVVHSMGNHLMTESMKTMADRLGEKAATHRIFEAVAMAAPDVNARDFVETVAARIQPFSRRFTVYASRYDKALSFSQQLNGWDPLGILNRYSVQLTRLPSFELVDVSDISNSWFATGHVYYGDMPEVMRDFHGLFLGRPIQSRGLLAAPPVFRLVRHSKP